MRLLLHYIPKKEEEKRLQDSSIQASVGPGHWHSISTVFHTRIALVPELV